MEHLKSVKSTPISEVLKIPTTGFVLPQVEKHPFNALTRINADSSSSPSFSQEERYIPLNSGDSLQWIKFVQTIIVNATIVPRSLNDVGTAGTVVILDCAYQWGSTDMPNSLMFSLKHQYLTQNPALDDKGEDLFSKVVIVDGVDDMATLIDVVLHIENYIPHNLHSLPLKCIIISNLSVFYWGMRESSNFEPTNELHRACRKISNKFGCYCVTSRSLYNE